MYGLKPVPFTGTLEREQLEGGVRLEPQVPPPRSDDKVVMGSGARFTYWNSRSRG